MAHKILLMLGRWKAALADVLFRPDVVILYDSERDPPLVFHKHHGRGV